MSAANWDKMAAKGEFAETFPPKKGTPGSDNGMAVVQEPPTGLEAPAVVAFSCPQSYHFMLPT